VRASDGHAMWFDRARANGKVYGTGHTFGPATGFAHVDAEPFQTCHSGLQSRLAADGDTVCARSDQHALCTAVTSDSWAGQSQDAKPEVRLPSTRHAISVACRTSFSWTRPVSSTARATTPLVNSMEAITGHQFRPCDCRQTRRQCKGRRICAGLAGHGLVRDATDRSRLRHHRGQLPARPIRAQIDVSADRR